MVKLIKTIGFFHLCLRSLKIKNLKIFFNLRQIKQAVNKQYLLLRICCLRTLPLLIGTATLFKIKSPSRLACPLGIIVLFLSITIASNFQEHLYEGLTRCEISFTYATIFHRTYTASDYRLFEK